MADKQIHELTAATQVNNEDLLVLQQDGAAKKLPGSVLVNYVSAGAQAKVTELSDAIDAKIEEVQEAIDTAEGDINTIVQVVESMTELGTDTTLTVEGMAADAKATGDKIKDVSIIARAGLEQESAAPGSIVTITDAAEDVPVKSMTIGIEPVQDLHGQSNPYPAGGGKNLLPPTTSSSTTNGVTFTRQTDGTVIANGTATSDATFIYFSKTTYDNKLLLSNGSYILNGAPSGSSSSTYYISTNGFGGINDYGSGSTFEVTDGLAQTNIVIIVKSGATVNNVIFHPMIRLASITDATYAPYENICPITGWTGANVYQGSDNLFIPQEAGKYISGSDGSIASSESGIYAMSTYVPISGNTLYYYIPTHSGTAKNYGYRISFYNANKQWISAHTMVTFGSVGTQSVPANAQYFRASSWEAEAKLSIGFSSGVSKGAIEPTTIPITFPNEAGTVYGGTLTNNRTDEWKLTVTWASFDLGAKNWSKSNGRFNTGSAISGIYTGSATACKSSVYKVDSGAASRVVDKAICLGNAGYVYVYDTSFTGSDTDFKAYIGNTQFIAQLATPVTYTLTASEVKTLLGLNNIWADTGDIEELTYYKPASAGKITSEVLNTVEPMIAGVEEELVATQNYAIGDLFIANHAFYKATAAITTGETIAPGSNCEATNVADELKNSVEELQESLDNKADIDGYYKELSVGLADNLASTVGIEDKVPYNFRTSGGAIDIGEFETDTIVGGTIAWNQLVTTDTNVSKTKSGSVVSVTDAVAENAQSLTVDIKPVQDLHGYDYPWPGGSGINEFNYDDITSAGGGSYGFTVTDNHDGTLRLYGTMQDKGGSANYVQFRFIYVTNAYAGKYFYYYPDKPDLIGTGSFTRGSDGHVAITVYGDNGDTIDVTIGVMCVSTQSRPSVYSPYSNICPITGFTEANVTRTGKNLLDANSVDLINSTAENIRYGIRFTKAGTYTVKVNDTTVSGAANIIARSYKDGVYGTAKYIGSGGQFTETISDGDAIIVFHTTNPSSGLAKQTAIDLFVNAKLQVELGSTASTYEAPNIATIPITFPNEASTVYGGTLTNNGMDEWTLRVEKACKTFVGDTSEGWSKSEYGYFVTSRIADAVNENAYRNNFISNLYPYNGITNNDSNVGSCLIWGGVRVRLSDMSITLEDWKASLTSKPLQVVYPIATPIEYTLTSQQVQMLLGANNVWSDTGDTSLTYLGTTNEIAAQANHKYLTKVNGASTIVNGSGQILSGEKARDNIFDLTQMFGTEIANYAYILEQTTTGTGVSWFNRLFPKPYYSHNAGELMSVNTSAHKMRGFNAWDEQWEVGRISTSTGEVTSAAGIRSKNYIPVIPNASYYIKSPQLIYIIAYDADKKYLRYASYYQNQMFTPGADVCYIKFYMVDITTYSNNICINLSWDGERDGEYEAYQEYLYPLDESLTLNGIPKLASDNSLYYDGDTYESDGKVTRKYGIYTFTGTEAWAKFSSDSTAWYITPNTSGMTNARYENGIMVLSDAFLGRSSNGGAAYSSDGDIWLQSTSSYPRLYICSDSASTVEDMKALTVGKKVLYPLATPTIETANPYTNPQFVDDFGTEEYVDYAVSQNLREVSVPVGHDTVYNSNLRAKLEMAPNSPDENGDYIVRKTNEGASYVPLTEVKELPNMPSIAGTYNLRLTIANGVPTLTWVMV